MNDFKSYSNAKNNSGDTPLDGSNRTSSDKADKIPGGGDTPPPIDTTLEMAKIISKAMNGKSTAQIMQTIIAEAERGKREGTLSNADLDNFYAALSPILDGAKRRKLKQVIDRLKNI